MRWLCAVVVSFSVALSQYEDTGVRGSYFSKKQYAGVPIPAFKEIRAKLPSPVLTANKDYVELYWKAWALAFDHLKQPPAGSPFVSNYIDEAFSPSVFQWDTIFMLMFARYAHALFPAIASLDNFYCRQYENGYICREIQEADGKDYVFVGREHTVNPPLFAWAEVETYRITGDKSRFESVYPVLKKYAEWLELYRVKAETVHGLFWNTGLGSGMDNMPLRGSGWVDMSSQMVLFYRSLAFIASEIGKKEEEKNYIRRADEISRLINRWMWNDSAGFYYNVDDNGVQQPLKCVAGFWPLVAGVADREKAQRLLLHLMDPRSFWRPIPFPSLAADEKDYHADGHYWLGGVWAPTNVMIIKGVERFEIEHSASTDYRFKEFAASAAEKYLDGLSEVFAKTGTLWENYSPELMMRGNPSQKDFVGWTGCGPIELLIENVLGFHPDAPSRSLSWNISRIDRHGIEQLHFGDITATLICQQRESVGRSADIHVVASEPFTLIVTLDGRKEKTFQVKKGIQQFKIE